MRAVALLVGLVLVGASCRSEPPLPVPDELVAAVRPLGSLDPLAVATEGDEALVARQVFEGLTTYDPETLEVRPALAASWTVDPDARTYSFLLRRGARFHTGREVTASDVVASLNRLARTSCDPATSPVAGAPAFLLSLVVGYADVAGACESDELAGVLAVGENTVSVALSEPWADFPAILAHPAASVVPAGETGGDFPQRPVGTGPYRVSAPWDGRSLGLERFEDHWGEQPSIARVRLVGYEEDALAYLDLLADTVDQAPVPVNRVTEARRRFGDEGFGLGVGLSFFGFNLRSDKVRQPAFRAALSRAIDRGALATAIYEGTREPADGISSPALPGAVPDGLCGELCAPDLAVATAYLSEAHPEDPPEIAIGTSEEGSNPAVAEALADMFDRIGVRARVIERPFTDHVRGVEAGDVDLFQFGWLPAYPTLEGMLRQLFRSRSPDNLMRYSNPEVDTLLREARGTLGDAERAELLHEAERKILADIPILPLLWYRSSLAFDPRLTSTTGALVDPLGLTDYARLTWEDAS